MAFMKACPVDAQFVFLYNRWLLVCSVNSKEIDIIKYIDERPEIELIDQGRVMVDMRKLADETAFIDIIAS